MAEDGTTGTVAGQMHWYYDPGRIMHHRFKCAEEFITRWGMVAAIPDGEDSAGRAKVRLATPEEVVERAIACADLLFKRGNELGWIKDAPEPKEKEHGDGSEGAGEDSGAEAERG